VWVRVGAELTGTLLTDDAAVATDEATDSRDETTSEVDWARATAAKVVKTKERMFECLYEEVARG